MSQLVLVDVADGVMTVTLNRPERKNALSNEAYGGLADAIERAEKDDQRPRRASAVRRRRVLRRRRHRRLRRRQQGRRAARPAQLHTLDRRAWPHREAGDRRGAGRRRRHRHHHADALRSDLHGGGGEPAHAVRQPRAGAGGVVQLPDPEAHRLVARLCDVHARRADPGEDLRRMGPRPRLRAARKTARDRACARAGSSPTSRSARCARPSA